MELLITLALGALLGYGTVKLHPRLDAGTVAGLATGALGGWLGARWFGAAMAARLDDHELAGAVAGAAVGALGLSLIVGAVAVALLRRRS